MDTMKKAWEILKGGRATTNFEVFLVTVLGVPRTEARKLTPSKSLTNSLGSSGKLTEMITENEFEQLINLVESEQYETLLRTLEQISSKYVPEARRRRLRRRKIPENKEKRNRRLRERYANDPEFRKKWSNPEYRRRQNELRRARRKKERKE